MTQALRILIVDDEPANLALLERALARDGHHCLRAETGEDAVATFTRELPDLVLMDVMLPGIDGFEATRRLRRHKTSRWIPVIFLSALNQPVDIVSGLDAGGDDYLTKPIDLTVLRSKIEASQRFVELHRQIEAKSQQLRRYYEESEAEKRLAVDMMRHLRRETNPPIPGVEFRTVAAIDVAGDIIAAAETPDGRLHLMLADATGHGLIAAINLLPAVEAFYGMTALGHRMPRIISRINDLLRQLIPGHRFVSAVFAAFDPLPGTVEVWNAGTPAALLLSPDGELLRRFESRNVPLGITQLAPSDLEGEIAAMAVGQVLVNCSDGLIEAENGDGQPFGERGLIEALPAALASGGCDDIVHALRGHTGNGSWADDVSVCIARQASAPHALGRLASGGPPQSCLATDIGFTMVFGPEQLQRLGDVTPRFMNLARSHFDLAPPSHARIYRIVHQLTDNAVAWGLLQLPADTTALPAESRRQRHEQALSALVGGRLRVSIHSCRGEASQRAWEIIVEDDGPGFDGPAALERAAGSSLRPGGLALVAAEAIAIAFDPPGNRVRVWVAE